MIAVALVVGLLVGWFLRGASEERRAARRSSMRLDRIAQENRIAQLGVDPRAEREWWRDRG